MSTRFVSINDINSVIAAVEDERGIELLEKIRDNEVKPLEESKLLKKRSEEEKQEFEAFVGQTKEDDLGIKEDDGSRGVLDLLADKGLIIKGGYIPLGKERINSYKITNEGLALLYLVKRIREVAVKRGGSSSAQPQQQPKQVVTTSSSSSNRGRGH